MKQELIKQDQDEQKFQDIKQREDVDSNTSSLKGFSGILETLLRRFRTVTFVIMLVPIYIIILCLMGLCLVPFLYIFNYVVQISQNWALFFKYSAFGISLTTGFFAYGFSLIFIIPLANLLLPTKLKEWRGIVYSLHAVPWYLHNALTYSVRYTFLKFITPTPINVLFYRMMGMRVGRGVQINTINISDPCLMTMEDKVIIGGSATIICHYAVGGYLVIAPVKIGKRATVGIKSTIMGDVEIGERAKVLPNSVVMPKTKIPAGEVWGGVPATFVKKARK